MSVRTLILILSNRCLFLCCRSDPQTEEGERGGPAWTERGGRPGGAAADAAASHSRGEAEGAGVAAQQGGTTQSKQVHGPEHAGSLPDGTMI